MIIASIRRDPKTDKRQAILEILMSVKTMTRLKHGCIYCGIYEEYGDGQNILYVETWHAKIMEFKQLRKLRRFIQK
jgi:quinol monooxygenase YgiN